MAPAGLRITREKRLALANCNGLLIRACDELDDVMGRSAPAGLEGKEVADIGPLALRVVELRRRRLRLQAELAAVYGEWAE